jgi:hypothetical protein
LGHTNQEQQFNNTPQPNILAQVDIDPTVEECLLNVIADIGRTIRFQVGNATTYIEMGEMAAQQDPISGGLVVKTSLGGELVEMVVPANSWKWKDPPPAEQ